MNNYKIKAFFCTVGTVIFVVLFFLSPYTIIKGVSDGLLLCATAVIPSLFPFMVLSDFLLRSGLAEVFGKVLEPVTKLLFRLPGSAGCTVIMSWVGGYPVGAKMTAELLENGSISLSQAKRMMLFCVNPGPAFVIGTVGTVIFSDRKTGAVLYAAMVLSSLVTGIFLRFFDDGSSFSFERKSRNFKAGVVPQSVMQGMNSVLYLCAWVVLFSCVMSAAELMNLPQNVMLWVRMFTEVTNGCVCAAGNFPLGIQALVMGFAGISVHCQLLTYIKQTQVRYLHFFLSRVVHGGLSACIAELLFKLFPSEADVFSTNTEVLPKLYSVSVPAAVSMLVLAAVLVTDIGFSAVKNNNGEA